ncbi:MAG TPA: glutathione transferase GstA [Allosphingosinicella sp.]
MTKLYYTPGACSLAPHIVLYESGAAFEAVAVDLRVKKLADGGDYFAVNPKGAVPAIGLENGEVLTENATILQYLADQSGSEELLPAGGLRRYRVLEWTTFVSTEIHKGFGPLWNPSTPAEVKAAARETLGKKFDFIEDRLGEGFLTGDAFTIADAYLFTVLRWTAIHDIDLGRWPGLSAYQQRVAARPKVAQALAAESAG